MLGVLRQQLTNLQTLKNRNHREAKNEEEGWKQITEGALIHGFGEGSHNLLPYLLQGTFGWYPQPHGRIGSPTTT